MEADAADAIDAADAADAACQLQAVVVVVRGDTSARIHECANTFTQT